MKPVHVMSSTYINFNVEKNYKNPEFEDGDDAKISKYNNIFARDYNANWSEEVFMIKKVNNTVPWTCVISDLKAKEIVGELA